MLWNLIRISASNLRNNKLRTFLTMLGIIIGISSIIAFITIGQGVTSAVVDQLSGLGGNRITVNIKNTTLKSGFTSAELEQFAALDNVRGVSPSMTKSRWVTCVPGQTHSVYDETTSKYCRIMGVSDYYFTSNAKNPIKYGRAVTDDDLSFATNVCVLGNSVWKQLYGNYNPVGETIRIGNIDFRIIGVMNSLVGMDVTANASILVPYTSAMETMQMGLVKKFDVIAADSSSIDSVMADVDDLCSTIFNSKGSDYTLVNQEEVMDIVVTVTDLILGMLAGIAAIALLVGGIGIMNMMLVTVSERTAEIGLRKALGAKPSVILLQFLIESVIISLLGGILGVLFGLGLSFAASYIIGYTFSFKATTVLAACGFSFVVGVVFGILPARRAAKMNPIDALRST